LPFSPEAKQSLESDMQDELSQLVKINRLKIIQAGEEKLGAEVGSIFVELESKQDGEKAYQKLNGRNYDRKKLKVVFIEESLYFSELFIN
jgi:hypothetical protein